MERLALIDLGSNSVRFVISEIADNGSYRLIYQEKESIRLSEGMWETNYLTEAAMKRAINALQVFSHMAEIMKTTHVYAVATAAVRFSRNGKAFIKRVYEETGITLTCISGEEEARLGFLGVINTIGLDNFVLFDLGGASTEVSLVENRQVVRSVSLPMGALTLTGMFQHGTELTTKEYDIMIAHIQMLLEDEPWLKQIGWPLVGIGGTARNMAKIDQRSHEYPIAKLHNYELKYSRIVEILELVTSKSLAQRRKIPGLSQERADIIVAGAALIQQLSKYVGAKSMYIGGSGLREGLFYDYYGKHYMNTSGVIDDILMHSAENVLLSMPQNDLDHVKYTANLADTIFEQWQSLHGCNERIRKLLMVAALLHDMGKQINYYSHARHSAYMLVNSNLYGISHVEQAICAFIVMNSHGYTNKLYKTSEYAKLLGSGHKTIIAKMSLILSVAEAIDESHEQLAVSVSSVITDREVVLTVWTKKQVNALIAMAAVDKLTKSFKKEFKKELLVEWKERL